MNRPRRTAGSPRGRKAVRASGRMRWLMAVVLCLGLIAATGLAAAWWALAPMAVSGAVSFTAPPGSSLRAITREAEDAGVPLDEEPFVMMARLAGLDTRVRSGTYEVRPGTSRWGLLQQMARGDVTLVSVTLIEGWTVRQIAAELARHPQVKQTLPPAAGPIEVGRALGLDRPAEGLLWPDTYLFDPGTPDVQILRRAYEAQQRMLLRAWEQRQAGVPYRDPYEALIMASIVEKETGRREERRRIAGVFTNRLKVGMPLQTDPTVIYGIGPSFDGNLRRDDLRRDTPWNTYTRPGLPPTPIAAAGWESLQAALQPESHRYFYFVARGDGSSAFSEDLATHNRYVDRYQRSR